ncbi:MAG TPA: NAD(+) diphosphatase [Methanoregula sp.]|nr:NAD(+) diphosphatase [Methanoregula sp.]
MMPYDTSFYSQPRHAVYSVSSLTQHFPEPENIPETGALWVLVMGNGVAIREGQKPQVYADACPLPDGRASGVAEYLGHRGTTPCYAAELPDNGAIPDDRVISGVRELYGRIPDEELAVAAYAVRMIASAKANRICGRCGAKTQPVLFERAKKCPECGLVVYPRISPAIIVRITRNDKILLARSPGFPPELHSVIAGFVEPGETLEHAVCREVREEVGIEIRNLRYFASEPWPFPDSLMIAFTAEHANGEIKIDNNEIVSAGWFDRDNLPRLPAQMSISRALIDHWIKQENFPR